MADPAKEFGITCPAGSKFYVCDKAKTAFVGCCTTDPCKKDGVCSSVRAATYDKSKTIPEQACSDGKWYTCPKLAKPFMGCCDDDPCSKGCSAKDLKAAVLSKDEKKARAFVGEEVKVTSTKAPPIQPTETKTTSTSAKTTSKTSTTSSKSSTSTSESTTTTLAPVEPTTLTRFVDFDQATEASATPTGSALPSSETPAPTGTLSTAAKAGIGVGGAVIGIMLVACLAHWFMKRFRGNKESKSYQPFPFEDDNRFRDAKPQISSSPSPPAPQAVTAVPLAASPRSSHTHTTATVIQTPEPAYAAPHNRSMSFSEYAAAQSIPPTRDSHHTMHTQRSSTFSAGGYGQGMGMGMPPPMAGASPYAMAAMHNQQAYMYAMSGQPMPGQPHPYPHPTMSPVAGQSPMQMHPGANMNPAWGYPMMGTPPPHAHPYGTPPPAAPPYGTPPPQVQPYGAGGQYQAYHPGLALAGASFHDSYHSRSPSMAGAGMPVNQSHVAVELEDTTNWQANQQQQYPQYQTRESGPDFPEALKIVRPPSATAAQPMNEKVPVPEPVSAPQVVAVEMEAPQQVIAKPVVNSQLPEPPRQPPSDQAQPKTVEVESSPPPPPPKEQPPSTSTAEAQEVPHSPTKSITTMEPPRLELNFTPSAPLSPSLPPKDK